jgi:hypothetical protein
MQTKKALAIQSAGRLSIGRTRLVERLPQCAQCKADGLIETPETGVILCAHHCGKAPSRSVVLVATGPALMLHLPAQTTPAGYARLILDYRLAVMPPARLTFIAHRGARRERSENHQLIVILPANYAPGAELVEQLEFALRYDGVSLEVLSAFFRRVDLDSLEASLVAFIKRKPTSQYGRKLWFLYEFLTNRRLPLKDVKVGNYVPLLDEADSFVGPPRRSRRQRVVDNLLGDARFSPTIRRTPALEAFAKSDLKTEVTRIVESFDEDTVRRAVSYLYTKETRSSFGIEGENPSHSRAERFVSLLKRVAESSILSSADLISLQNATVDERFADKGWRDDQVYVGEQVDLSRQRVHFIAPKPGDVAPLMEGFVACLDRLANSTVEPIAHAAAISFGFVFIHPFSDGNGRLHRLLIHHVLTQRGLTPKGLVFPVSAVMLARRAEYDACLERFSVPLMRLIDFDEDDAGVITVKNETAGLYRFFDATAMAEALARWVDETVKVEFRAELDFIVRFRAIRAALDAVIELPDRLVNLFIKACLHNKGRISVAKRHHFQMLTDSEVRKLENVVKAHLKGFGVLVAK